MSVKTLRENTYITLSMINCKPSQHSASLASTSFPLNLPDFTSLQFFYRERQIAPYLTIGTVIHVLQVHHIAMTTSFKKLHLKVSSGKWQPLCLSLDMLRKPSSNPISSPSRTLSIPFNVDYHLERTCFIINYICRHTLKLHRSYES